MSDQTVMPTSPPRTDRDCWPFPCRDYHATAAHREGLDPCACPCHKSPKRRDHE